MVIGQVALDAGRSAHIVPCRADFVSIGQCISDSASDNTSDRFVAQFLGQAFVF